MNNIETLMNELILPAAAKRLRGQLTMPQLIHNDVEDVAQQVGDEIKIAAPVYFADGADEKTPNGETTSSAINADKVTIKLDRQFYKQWQMTDQEFMSHASSNTLPSAMEAAIDAIAESVNAVCFDLYKQISNYSGDAINGDVEATKQSLIALRAELQKNKVRKGRTVVLSDDTESSLLGEFSNLAESGDSAAVTEGLIGRKFGFDVYGDIQAPVHVPGASVTETGVVTEATAAGKAINLAGFTAGVDFSAGDIIELADGNKLTVASDVTATGTAATIPVNESVPAIDADIAVSFPIQSAHGVDLGFHKSFAAIAFRKLKTAGEAPGVSIAEFSDPILNIPLRMMSWYSPTEEATFFKISTLLGASIVDASRAVRMGTV